MGVFVKMPISKKIPMSVLIGAQIWGNHDVLGNRRPSVRRCGVCLPGGSCRGQLALGFAGTSVGSLPSAITSGVTTTFATSLRDGRSNIVPISASSMIARKPRAPALAGNRLSRNRLERVRLKLQIHAVHLHQLAVLTAQGVARLGQNAHQRVLVEVIQRHDNRQTADQTPESGQT